MAVVRLEYEGNGGGILGRRATPGGAARQRRHFPVYHCGNWALSAETLGLSLITM